MSHRLCPVQLEKNDFLDQKYTWCTLAFTIELLLQCRLPWRNWIQLWYDLCFFCFPLSRGEPASIEWKKDGCAEKCSLRMQARSTIAKGCQNYVWHKYNIPLCNIYTVWPLTMTVSILARRIRLNNSNLILVCAIFSLSSGLSSWCWYSTPEILSDKAWVGCT